MCIYYIKKESWGVLVRLGVFSGILGRPGVIRLTGFVGEIILAIPHPLNLQCMTKNEVKNFDYSWDNKRTNVALTNQT